MPKSKPENVNPREFLKFKQDADLHERIEKQLKQAKHLYATLSQVNQTIVRVKAREELYQSICDVAVQFGNFALAWIGLLDEASGEIRPVAAHGLDPEKWPFPIANLNQSELQNSLVVLAIQSARVVTSEDLQSDQRVRDAHSLIEKYGYHSLAVVPFQSKGRTIGVLSLMSQEPGLFTDAEEVHLLEEMGSDISFALDHIESEERYQNTLDQMLEGCQIIDFDWRYSYINAAAAAQGRSTTAELLNHTMMELYPGIEDTALFSVMRDCMQNRVARVMENEFIFADGSRGWFELSMQPAPEGIFILSVDITERKLANEKIQASEERYRTLFTNMAEGIAYCQMLYEDGEPQDWVYLSVNPAFETQTGLTEIVGKKVTEAIPGIRETDPELFEIYGRVASTGVPEKFETFVEALKMWFAVSVYSPAKDYFIAIFDVITERKLAEEELRASGERYRNLVENMNDVVFDIDAQGNYCYVSPNFESFSGFRVDEALNRSPFANIHLDDLPELRHKLELAFTSGQQSMAYRAQNKQGEWRWIETTGKRYQASDGNPHVISVARDITESRRAQIALIASEENYRSLVENAESAIAVVDRDGRILYVNPWSIQVWNDPDLVGKTISDIYRESYANEYLSVIHSVIDTQTSYLDLVETPVNGSMLWFRFSMSPLKNPDGIVDRLLLNAWDITDQKKKEEELIFRNVLMTTQKEASIDAILVVDENAQILSYNKHFVEMWAIPQEMAEAGNDETVLQSVTALVADPQPFLERVQYLYQNQTETGQDEFSLKDGRVIERYSAPMVGSEDRYFGRIWYFRDITERKQTEELISRLAKFPSENPYPVLRVDGSGVILYANQASGPVLRLWDREAGQKVPSSWQAMIASALQTGQNLENEMACGEKIFSASLAPVVDHGYVNIYASDVTERKRAEENVFESQRQMEALVTSLDDIVFELDERGTYLNVWTADENLLFQPKDQLLGREMKEVLGKETGRQFMDAMGSVLASGDPATIEYPLEVGGSQMWFMGRLSLIHSSDPSSKTVSMLVRDITEKKLAEREIQRHNEELKLINDLNEAVNRGEDIDSINALFAQQACQMFACRYVAFYLISPDGKFVEMQTSSMSAQLTEKIEHLIGRSFPKMRIPLKDGGYFKDILAKGQGAISSDPQAIQRWLGEFANTTYLPPELRDSVRSLIPQLFEMMQIRAILSIPMISSGRTIGLLEMLTSEMFTDHDLQRMRVIGPQITAVIQRILAEEQVQRQLQRLRALSEIDRAISSSLDMRFSLDILINEVRSLLGVDAVAVMLLNETSLKS